MKLQTEQQQTEPLTPQEFKVATLTAGGFSIKEIADKLHRSIHTVTTQRKTINRKLCVNKDTEVSRWWFCTMFGITAEQVSEKMKLAGVTAILFLFTFHLTVVFDDTMRRTRRGRRNETEYAECEYPEQIIKLTA